jgi:hypothetical protein
MGNAQRIADAITEALLAAAVAQAQAVERVLRKLVSAGHSMADMGWEKHWPNDVELLVCRGIRVLLITRSIGQAEIVTRYTLYPDGRPGGWPELDFEAPHGE